MEGGVPICGGTVVGAVGVSGFAVLKSRLVSNPSVNLTIAGVSEIGSIGASISLVSGYYRIFQLGPRAALWIFLVRPRAALVSESFSELFQVISLCAKDLIAAAP
jgi:hypothetical protein